MDWTQTLTIIGTGIAMMTWLEHRFSKIEERLDRRFENSEGHWRELFKYFNDRLDRKERD